MECFISKTVSWRDMWICTVPGAGLWQIIANLFAIAKRQRYGMMEVKTRIQKQCSSTVSLLVMRDSNLAVGTGTHSFTCLTAIFRKRWLMQTFIKELQHHRM